MKYIFSLLLFVAGMAHAAAREPLLPDDNDFEHVIIPDDVVQQAPLTAAAATSALHQIPIFARSVERTLVPEAAIHKMKLRWASEHATPEEFESLEKMAQQHNYVATPEQPAKSTQLQWINLEASHDNVKAIDDLTREKRQKPLSGKEPQRTTRRRLF